MVAGPDGPPGRFAEMTVPTADEEAAMNLRQVKEADPVPAKT